MDEQLLLIFCSLVRTFVQIFLIIKFELVWEGKHATIRPPSLKCPFDTKSIPLCFFQKTQQRTERFSLPVYLSHSSVILIFQRDRTWCKLEKSKIKLICSANQWTGFYMVVTSVMKEFMQFFIQRIREVADASSLRSMVPQWLFIALNIYCLNTNKCNSILAFSKQIKTSIKKIYYCLIFPRLYLNALMCQMDISCKNIWIVQPSSAIVLQIKRYWFVTRESLFYIKQNKWAISFRTKSGLKLTDWDEVNNYKL